MGEIFYRCKVCGNIVALIKTGGGTLTCCGQEMEKLVANTVDASKEKHVPAVSVDNNIIKVEVGSVLHPMVPEHYIEWIALVADDKIEIKYLKPGMEPKAEFEYNFSYDEEKVPYTDGDGEIPNCEGQPCNFVYTEKKANNVSIYEYCNLHGLWKTEIK
ncbi:MAG: desulfoferrodoxin FeS4 iron-binding domain-containing protein [Clostridiaceae bacterium]|nr:desulfoferrodoxin FeS4 iron-binding domain-containing protein [Clostridiaceae bacterium]